MPRRAWQGEAPRQTSGIDPFAFARRAGEGEPAARAAQAAIDPIALDDAAAQHQLIEAVTLSLSVDDEASLEFTQPTTKAAALLGKDADAEAYARIAEEVRQAFLAEYVTPAGRMMSDAQTAG